MIKCDTILFFFFSLFLSEGHDSIAKAAQNANEDIDRSETDEWTTPCSAMSPPRRSARDVVSGLAAPTRRPARRSRSRDATTRHSVGKSELGMFSFSLSSEFLTFG